MGFVADAVGGLLGGGPNQPNAPQIDRFVNQQQADQSYANTQNAMAQQQAFLNAAQGQNGLQNQSNVYNQLSQVAQGQGPNPAQAMLAQSTGANVANQAALMAGQRGAGANAGLIARQAGMQGGALQQQAAGQGATMQANQSLGALGQMGQVAGQQVGNQQAALQGANQLALGQQSNLLGAAGAANNAAADVYGSQAQMYQADQKRHGDMFGSLLNAAGAIAPLAFGPAGGLATAALGSGGGAGRTGSNLSPGLADGGMIDPKKKTVGSIIGFPGFSAGGGVTPPANGPQSALGRALNMKAGGEVPGKPKVAGDDHKNDTVPAMLSPGEIVIPRSIAQGKDAPSKAAAFVEAVLAKSRLKK